MNEVIAMGILDNSHVLCCRHRTDDTGDPYRPSRCYPEKILETNRMDSGRIGITWFSLEAVLGDECLYFLKKICMIFLSILFSVVNIFSFSPSMPIDYFPLPRLSPEEISYIEQHIPS